MIRAKLVGRQAAQLLKDKDQGRVITVFDDLFYVEVSRGILVVARDVIDLGPLLVSLGVTQDHWDAFKPQVGTKVDVSAGRLSLGERFVVSTLGAPTWKPAHPNVIDLKHGLASLARAKALRPAEGYAPFLFFPKDNPELGCANTALHKALEGAALDPSSFAPLLGRGPGLTPSGDDVLGGMMIALHALGRGEMARKLWAGLKPIAETRTHQISCAMLQAASTGEGTATLHAVMNAFLTGQNRTQALAALSKIGHSSGWDTFVGIVMVARAGAESTQAA